MSRTIITNKQRNLILHSEAAKGHFQDLYDYLMEHEELRTEDLKIYKQFKNIDSYYDQLLNECQSEWGTPKTNAIIDLGNEYKKLKRECELCGQQNIRWEHRIVNSLSENSLVVGSECAKEFGDDLQGVLRDELKNVKRASKMHDIEEMIPGIRNFISNSHRFINTLEIIIPIALDRKWSELSKKFTKEYNEFIKSKSNNVEQLKSLWKHKVLLERDINQYIIENKKEKYIANKNVFGWLLKNRKFETIEMIKEDNGFIQWRTAHRIYEENFMKEIVLDLTPRLMEIEVYPRKVNSNSKKVILHFNKEGKSINGVISFEMLILDYAGVLFENNIDYSFGDIYNACQIEDSESIDKILSFTQNSRYRLNKKYIDDGELIYISNGKYLLCDLNKVIKEFKKYYYSSTLDKENISQIIKGLADKPMDIEEFELYKEIKREAKHMNKREY